MYVEVIIVHVQMTAAYQMVITALVQTVLALQTVQLQKITVVYVIVTAPMTVCRIVLVLGVAV